MARSLSFVVLGAGRGTTGFLRDQMIMTCPGDVAAVETRPDMHFCCGTESHATVTGGGQIVYRDVNGHL